MARSTDGRPAFFTCWFAINKLGAIWVPINTAYRHEFLRHQITDSRARLVICDPHYLERVIEISDQLPAVELILSRDSGPFPDCSIPIQPLDEHRGSDDTPLPILVGPADLASLIYTSGTTGPAKGCMISHNYMSGDADTISAANPRQQSKGIWNGFDRSPGNPTPRGDGRRHLRPHAL